MSRTATIIAENQPGQIGVTLTDPGIDGSTVCAAALAQFADLDASCQIVSASIPVSQTVNRQEVPGVYCNPIPESIVQSVTDEYSVSLELLLDESVAAGVARFLFENSGRQAWVLIGADGDDPPKAVAEVRLVSAELFGAPGGPRTVTVSLPASGKPSVCFGDATASVGVPVPDPNNISATYPAAATQPDLATLKADGTSGDTGSGPPYNGGTGTASAFTIGQYIVLGDASQAHWDGAAWLAGPAT